jgi:hypothetical protein
MMPHPQARQLVPLSLLVLALAGCAPGQDGAGGRSSAIAPPFAEFLDAHPGLDSIGEPLTAPRTAESVLRQTFVSAELTYDSGAPEREAVSLAPLGLSLGLAEPAVPPPGDPAARYVTRTGHTVYTGFLEIYGRLGGEPIAGAPISEVHFEGGLIYQYFEGLGLYRVESAPPSEARLFAFGNAWLGEAAPSAGRGPLLPPDLRPRPFAEFLDRLGGEAFFGRPLSDPQLTADGALEQVYERAVLWAPAGDPDRVRLRPLGLALGAAEPPAAPEVGGEGLFVAATGHNVHRVFAAFYRVIDGREILGAPLGEAQDDGGLLRQRFENGILEYSYALPPHLAIQLAPLGLDYVPQAVPEATGGPTATAPPAPTPSGVPGARTWVDHPILSPGTLQRIHVEVLRGDGTPWSGVVPLVRIAAPQGPLFPAMPPTDEQGRSSAAVDLGALPAGEIISYEVVVTGEFGTAYTVGQFAARWASQ